MALSGQLPRVVQSAPHISIVICTRNRADRLPQMLQAVSCICTSHPWEVLLVDNASTDNTAEVIANHLPSMPGDSRYLLCETVGLGAARDFAWRRARGSIVCFTDDDCYPEPDLIDAIVIAFKEHPEVGALGGRIRQYNPSHARATIQESEVAENFPAYSFFPTGPIHGANLSVRKAAIEAAGGVDNELGAGTRFKAGEDVDLIAATLWSGFPARYDPRPTVWHNHGRVDADLPQLSVNYDVGRGAYYAKFLARYDSRSAFLRGWWQSHHDIRYVSGLKSMLREGAAGFRYLKKKRRYALIATLTPIFIIGLTAATVRLAFRRLTGGGELGKVV